MKRNRRFLGAVLVCFASVSLMVGCTNSDNHEEIQSTYTIKDGQMSCENGGFGTVDVGGLLYPYEDFQIAYAVEKIYIEDGVVYAIVDGLSAEIVRDSGQSEIVPRLSNTIALGESFDAPGFATITLVSATPMTDRGIAGYGGRATFCIQPRDGIKLSSIIQSN